MKRICKGRCKRTITCGLVLKIQEVLTRHVCFTLKRCDKKDPCSKCPIHIIGTRLAFVVDPESTEDPK
jgi:hypothetical protein